MAAGVMQPGDFFLAPISGPVGKGIKVGIWLNGEGFDSIQHAGIYLGDGKTLEAYPRGACVRDIARFDPASVMWSTVPLTDEQRTRIVWWAYAYRATPYSFVDYLAIAIHRAHLPLPFLKRYIASGGHMICSQLVDQVYRDAGINLFDDNRWPGYVTPASLIPFTDRGKR